MERPSLSPRFCVAFGILLLTFVLAAVMSTSLVVKAHAQDRAICAPADVLFRQFAEVVKEKIIWEGTMPVEQGVLQFVLFQSEKGTWTLFVVQNGVACMRARGEAGTPNELGKGT